MKQIPQFVSRRHVETVMHAIVLFLSVILVIYISVDTIKGIPFMGNRNYMAFQLFVCIVFMIDFFFGLLIAPRKWRYFRRHLVFLLLSVPYLNIIQAHGITLTHEQLYFLRIIPLARGALALAIIVGYISANRISSLFVSYISILLAIVYIASLMFYAQEQGVNPSVTGYWSALWWTCMDVTTIGSNIYPVTVTGKILGVVLAGMGMILFPLFTVYVTDILTRRQHRNAP